MKKTNAKDYKTPEIKKRNRVCRKLLYLNFDLQNFLKKDNQTVLDALNSEIVRQLDFFNSKTDRTRADYKTRLSEIALCLERSRPQNIFEMGSGRSSLVFAAWAAKHAVPYVAFEQLDFWAKIGNEATNVLSKNHHIKRVDIESVDQLGGRFIEDIPLEADFIYVDAPTIQKGVAPFMTYTGKAAYTDVPDFLRQGGRPKIVMIEGRTSTVDLILSVAQDLNLNFTFQPGFHWAIERNYYAQAFKGRLHSIFEFKF